MKIYFDEKLIDSLYYAGLTKTGTIYQNDGSFFMGATICETYKLTINKEANVEVPEIITIYENDVLSKTLYVDNYSEDDFTITYELTDAMIKFNIAYDASVLFEDGKTTLLAIFKNICMVAGIETDITEFYGSNIEVSWYDNTYMARDYLSYIAELNACNVRINSDNKLEFVEINTDAVASISFDEIGKYKIGQQHIITRVVWDDGNNKWEAGNTSGETYYINTSNVYVISEDIVNAIYDKINGFSYYNFKVDDCPMADLKVGDLIEYTYKDNVFKTFVQYTEINYSGGNWFGGIEVQVKGEQQIETQVIGIDKKMKAIKTIVDRDNNRITNLVSKTERNTEEIKKNYEDLVGQLEEKATIESLVALQESTQTQLDEKGFQITSIQQLINEQGVPIVFVQTGYTFDVNGLLIQKENEEMKFLANNKGIYVSQDNENVLTADANGVIARNVKIEQFLIQEPVRFEKTTTMTDGSEALGLFYI